MCGKRSAQLKLGCSVWRECGRTSADMPGFGSSRDPGRITDLYMIVCSDGKRWKSGRSRPIIGSVSLCVSCAIVTRLSMLFMNDTASSSPASSEVNGAGSCTPHAARHYAPVTRRHPAPRAVRRVPADQSHFRRYHAHGARRGPAISARDADSGTMRRLPGSQHDTALALVRTCTA